MTVSEVWRPHAPAGGALAPQNRFSVQVIMSKGTVVAAGGKSFRGRQGERERERERKRERERERKRASGDTHSDFHVPV